MWDCMPPEWVSVPNPPLHLIQTGPLRPDSVPGNRVAAKRFPAMSFPLVLMSFCVGLLIGLTSMGGAALMAPFLILVVGVRPITAVGTDLVYSAVTKVVGGWIHWKQGSVDLP